MNQRNPAADAAMRPVAIKPAEGPPLSTSELMERIIAAGDISALSPGDRAHYIVRVCESVGLNPLSQPFDLIPAQGGKLKLYPNKSATDQLRKIYRLRTITRSAQVINDTYVVEVEVTDAHRSESNIGAVSIKGLQGEALAHAMMKSHTKAKRRATLDWCGLGVLEDVEYAESERDAREAPQSFAELVDDDVQDLAWRLDDHDVDLNPEPDPEHNPEMVFIPLGDTELVDALTGELRELTNDPEDDTTDPDRDLWVMTREQLKADIQANREAPLSLSWPDIMAHAAERNLHVDRNDDLVALARDVRQMRRELTAAGEMDK